MSSNGEGLVLIWRTSANSIDAAKDRERFNTLLNQLNITQPQGGIAKSNEDALEIAENIGYSVVVRTSYVLGGHAMEIIYSDDKLKQYLEIVVQVDPERLALIDKYVIDACETDIVSLSDFEGNVVVGGIMEHIKQDGIHSGDLAYSLPTKIVSPACLSTIRSWTYKLAKQLHVCGLMNCQYAITPTGEVYLLEGNPRASPTVPFVREYICHPLEKYATLSKK